MDPIETRRAQRAKARLDAAKAITFKQCAESYIKAHCAGWRNSKHADQWEATLKTYAEPTLGALPVQAVNTALVFKVLERIWTTKPETANRLRGRIESILDFAKAREWREGENPARWRGHRVHLIAPLPSLIHCSHVPRPRPLRRLPDGRGRRPTANVPGDFAPHRRTAAATTCQHQRECSMVRRSTATNGRSPSKCQ
jgi:hypothetical protein